MPKLWTKLDELKQAILKLRSIHQVEVEGLCAVHDAEIERLRFSNQAEVERLRGLH